MKLNELAAPQAAKQAAKVFESYFGQSIDFDSLNSRLASNMLNKVQGLIKEHRQTTDFHTSEQNPSYLKLVVLETALKAKVKEQTVPGQPSASVAVQANKQPTLQQQANQAATLKTAQANAQAPTAQAAGIMTQQKQQQITNIQSKKNQGGKLTPDEQTALLNQPITTQEGRENRLYNMLKESEVQQAQTVVTAKKLVSDVQKMLEQVTSIQFKDLPALVEQIRYQVGIEQATQYNDQVNTALGTLADNLQGAKTQLEQALSIVTGQEPIIPGQGGEVGPETAADVGVEELGDELGGEEVEELPEPEEEVSDIEASLGRERR